MGLQFAAARAISALSTWGLKNVFHRPAANFPGKIALYVDPCVIAHASSRLREGSIVVVGTNGKTTTTNLLADVLETDGKTVTCNRTGANLDSGVATSLLHSKGADWGVFESDELWLAKILPHLQATYVVLLNLFRDQLDRCGEIDRIQESIIGALKSSPRTTLIYNADDPLCAYIADRVDNASIAFGVSGDLHLPQNSVADAQMCQRCSTMFEYAFRQYGQLGDYCCPQCGFARPTLDYAVTEAKVAASGVSFAFGKPQGRQGTVSSSLGGAYMVYNLAAVAAAADCAGASEEALQRAIDAFDPQNGRLQTYHVQGRSTLLNLAKNPTGFNQNLRIIEEDSHPKAVAFFVNDKEGDGRDISWLWDIDFEEIADQDVVVFAGGLRKNDLQVRLKYAGFEAQLIDSASEVFASLDHAALPNGSPLPPDARVYLIANYTALPPVHEELDRMNAAQVAESAAEPAWAARETELACEAEVATSLAPQVVRGAQSPCEEPACEGDLRKGSASASLLPPLVIAHLFPDLLNLYGDGGNVRILEQRCRWRGVPVEVKRVHHGESVDLSAVDLVFMGGGPDREQRLASEELMRMKEDLRSFVEDDGALLAICGGYQILGRTWLLGDEIVEGLGLVGMETRRSGASANRLIGDIVLDSSLSSLPVVGYENHAGRTYLDADVEPFGVVKSSVGCGNNDEGKVDGVRYRNVLGTYLHGPLLAKNPEVADAILERALQRWACRNGCNSLKLALLDDAQERAANEYMCARLNVGK